MSRDSSVYVHCARCFVQGVYTLFCLEEIRLRMNKINVNYRIRPVKRTHMSFIIVETRFKIQR